MNKKELNLIIVGVGGQGNIITARIIGDAARIDGYKAKIGDVFGTTQRGGSVSSHIRISKTKECGPIIPFNSADVIIGFEPMEAARVFRKFGNSNAKVLLNPEPIPPISVLSGGVEYPSIEKISSDLRKICNDFVVVEASKLAREMGAPITFNMLMIGCCLRLGWIPVKRNALVTALEKTFSGDKRKLNKEAFDKGYELFADRDSPGF